MSAAGEYNQYGMVFIFSTNAALITSLTKQGMDPNIRTNNALTDLGDSRYSPFKNLDDSNPKAAYQHIFQTAGFKNIRFHKDPFPDYEDKVIYITAEKPPQPGGAMLPVSQLGLTYLNAISGKS